MECPFCGMTLIKTNYEKIRKLLNDEAIPRAKVCAKCGNVAALKLSAKGKQTVLSKISEGGQAGEKTEGSE